MNRREPKILMIGWEFPPVINGGLGIACHDLSSALAEKTEVTLILPKSDPAYKINKLRIMGLNNIDVNSLSEISTLMKMESKLDVREITANLDPYYSNYTEENITKNYISEVKIGENKYNVFNIDNLYGGDIIQKVIQFGQLAAKLSEKIEFDVIHAHDWMTMIAGVEIKKKSGKPLVLHIHSLEIDRGGENCRGWVYDLEKYAMENADLLMPVSNFTANIIKKHYGISGHKISPVHNGVRPVNSFKSKRQFTEKTVLFVGRLTRQKGPEHFLEIAAEVLKHSQDVRFVMAGTGENFKKLIEGSSYKNLGNRFHFTGFLNGDKLKYLLSVADVYCMPSVSEPFGLSAVEAAQFGLPCVISKQSGVSEVLTGSLKFDFWDVKKAAACIAKVLNDKVLREKLIEDAFENLKKINWHISAQKVLDNYQNHNIICKN
jgi:glycogen synthase